MNKLASALGPVLHKALGDTHKYYCRLRTGERICFIGARYIDDSDWITLIVKSMDPPPKDDAEPINLNRGLTVRVADIVWVIDHEGK